jgi:hypothetical protein
MMSIMNELDLKSVVLPVSIWMSPSERVIRDVAISANQPGPQKGTYDLSENTLQEDLEYSRWIRENGFDNLRFLADCTPNLLDESSHPRFGFGRRRIGVTYCLPSIHQHQPHDCCMTYISAGCASPSTGLFAFSASSNTLSFEMKKSC